MLCLFAAQSIFSIKLETNTLFSTAGITSIPLTLSNSKVLFALSQYDVFVLSTNLWYSEYLPCCSIIRYPTNEPTVSKRTVSHCHKLLTVITHRNTHIASLPSSVSHS